jgi:hypothetical protein
MELGMAHYITHVRTEQPYGYAHPHIAEVRLSDGTVETRAQVINYILNHGMIYMTQPVNAPAARVIVASCKVCGSGDYITTAPDSTTANNLLDLPRF